ncbi:MULTISPECIES: hypothetical protein [Micromonospora]|uniref:Gram-positive cocci surface proteins LPxTG domain-containing protein n=1 Tax=Micromonospora sicca TaxID=2202420 RepID=A0A317DP22_9ACTN|nr:MULTISPECIES: hypothetical protein [unclassified Micromonospora]MBM0227276.1 hypothetical protein [Micromonospora sp. ATA51]PWR14675.1 hypothetical protein DKT69_15110 [Micromonospora sp. 4G51]
MRLSRIIMAFTVGLAVAAVPTAAGAAQPQPQPPGYVPQLLLTLNPTAIPLGASFTLHGSGFTPNGTVTIDVSISALPPVAAPAQGTARRSDGSTVAMAAVAYSKPQSSQPQPAPLHFSVTANSAGEFEVSYTPTRVGRYTFTATDEASDPDRTASVTGVVYQKRPPKPPHHDGGGHLPVTGASLNTPMKLGGGLLGSGAVLLLLTLAWRRRERLGLGGR